MANSDGKPKGTKKNKHTFPGHTWFGNWGAKRRLLKFARLIPNQKKGSTATMPALSI